MKVKIMIFFIILLVLSGVNVIAQTEINGSIENQASVRMNGPFDFMKINELITLKISSSIEDNVSVYAELDLKHSYGNDDMPGPSLQYGDTDNYLGINLKEIYIDLAMGIFDFRLGSQVVSWGKVDAFAPTDNINPMDYRGFDILDFSNMKIAIPMIKADAYLFDYYLHIEGIYIPYFFGNVYPGQDSDWAFYQPPTPDTMVIDGSTYNVDSVVQNSTVYPSQKLEHSEAGVRAASSIGGYDFSGSYFYTWDDNPTVHQEFSLDSPGPGDVTVTATPEYHRLHIIGLDLAKAIGELSIRTESAFFITEDTEGADSDIADPYLRWAIGADYAFFTDYSINLQFSEEITNLNFNTFDQVDTMNTIILGLTGNFLEERLYVELGAIYELEDEDYLIVPKIEYDFSDSLSLTAGAYFFGGDTGTQFGSFDEN
ncbi:MAG: hypothetical protein KAR21_13140, partial [Spirochaetales bacterium]|nr:hypothetical protein [Spirochaetales bacterium]